MGFPGVNLLIGCIDAKECEESLIQSLNNGQAPLKEVISKLGAYGAAVKQDFKLFKLKQQSQQERNLIDQFSLPDIEKNYDIVHKKYGKDQTPVSEIKKNRLDILNEIALVLAPLQKMKLGMRVFGEGEKKKSSARRKKKKSPARKPKKKSPARNPKKKTPARRKKKSPARKPKKKSPARRKKK
jgi:hypothetical protein